MGYSQTTLWLMGYILWNLCALLLVMADKRRARRAAWRVRERTLFLMAAAFGATGILLGMRMFRHKTCHRSFALGIPVLCLVNLGCGYFLWRQHWFFR